MPQTSIAFETCSAHRAIATLPGSKRCKTQGDDVFLSDATNRTVAGQSQAGSKPDTMVATVPDKPSEVNSGSQKVNRKRLSRLMSNILAHVDGDDGIERGELVASLYNVERRYCGHWTDPCMRPKELREYERRYRRAQPTITRALKKLESRGLVRLIRHQRYVKKVILTAHGRIEVNGSAEP